jgi:hypothetical protein
MREKATTRKTYCHGELLILALAVLVLGRTLDAAMTGDAQYQHPSLQVANGWQLD